MLYIFDWDGTLSNSIDKIVHSVNFAALKAGLEEIPYASVQNIVGLGLREAIHALYPDIDPAKVEVLRNHYAQHYMELDQESPSPLFPNVLSVLERLRAEGHRLAVATGKSRRGLDRVLRQHEVHSLFHTSRCADESGSKPHPQMLLEILAELNVQPDQAVMIGDTEYDLEMAARIQMPRIGVSYGAHSVERLMKWDPLACMDDFSELLQLPLYLDATPPRVLGRH